MRLLYLDTSSLVKLYVDEPGSDEVRALLDAHETIAVADLAYVEFRAAISRRRREGLLSAKEIRSVKTAFDSDWHRFAAVPLTWELCTEAGTLAERYALRANDSLHLAAYASLARAAGVRNIEFSGFDHALNSAAHSMRRGMLRR